MKTLFAISTLAVAAAFAAASPAAAQTSPDATDPGAADPSTASRVRTLIVYGDDPCPQSSGDDIIVCARRPETERYRIPENMREPAPGPGGESWASRATSLETVGETGTQSCSTVGPGGWTGCWEEIMRQWRGDRRSAPATRPQDR